eukprot:scaffold56727_cov40-Phaeocystis_antarctica.AAC.2
MASPGCRSRLLRRYPRGVSVGPHPGGAVTTRDHARQLDTDPVGVAQEFRRYGGGERLTLKGGNLQARRWLRKMYCNILIAQEGGFIGARPV